MFDRKDGCEYVFIWRTSVACPIRKSQGTLVLLRRMLKYNHANIWSSNNNVIMFISPLPGDECHVRDPMGGYEFDLSSLKGMDYPVRSDKYIYHLSVCGGLQKGICTHIDTGSDLVSSCQVDGTNHRIAGTDLQNS